MSEPLRGTDASPPSGDLGSRPGGQPGDRGPLGLYLHIPFCEAICNYCNFNRGLLDVGLKRRYLHALHQELEDASTASSQVPADSLFFGGGTPSVLDPDEVRALVAHCRSAVNLAPGAEITLEVNPETVSPERLDGYRKGGVNRLSLGVQSFRDEDLSRLGRLHTAARAVEAFRVARAAGFDDISIDLMVWLPEQTVEEWLESVETLVGLDPDHVSFYLLELYPNAPLKDEMARGGWAQAPQDRAADMYHVGVDRLAAAGYEQYEISNAAHAGRRSRHNLKYWSDGAWVGFGCGAHSTCAGERWQNVSGIGDYIDLVDEGRAPVGNHRRLSMEERLTDTMFLGLRLSDGIDMGAVRRQYGVDVWSRWGSELAPFVESGLLVRKSDRLRLTRSGMLLANEVMQVFVS
ncbi:MAG: radical SAM family heme chaperone HemW [Acidobacteriota bacterium]|nr:radical SAM family heme chaperone HemW [Acidobacteriota bacterium]